MQGSKRDTDVNNRLLDSVGEGEDGMIWGNSTETCILPYVKQMTSASLMHEAEYSKLVLWDNVQGCGEEESNFRMWGHMCTGGWFMLMYVKNHPDIVK